MVEVSRDLAPLRRSALPPQDEAVCLEQPTQILVGEETLVLDFRDAQNPKKTVGAAVTPEFPPGVGNDRPIVFGATAR